VQINATTQGTYPTSAFRWTWAKQCGLPNAHGRRKGSQGGAVDSLDLEDFSKKRGCFLRVEWENKFRHFSPAL